MKDFFTILAYAVMLICTVVTLSLSYHFANGTDNGRLIPLFATISVACIVLILLIDSLKEHKK